MKPGGPSRLLLVGCGFSDPRKPGVGKCGAFCQACLALNPCHPATPLPVLLASQWMQPRIAAGRLGRLFLFSPEDFSPRGNCVPPPADVDVCVRRTLSMPKLYDHEQTRAACSGIRISRARERANVPTLLPTEPARRKQPIANPYSQIRINSMFSATCEQFSAKPLKIKAWVRYQISAVAVQNRATPFASLAPFR